MNDTSGPYIIRVARQIGEVFRKELSLYKGRPALWVATAVVSMIPTLYTVIYIGALWDPYGNASRLPVGIVNADGGTELRGKRYNLGKRLVEELKKESPFRFTEYPLRETADSAVRSGDVYFALVVPSDFSSRALSGSESASLTLITSEGTSYVSSLIADRFAGDVVDKMNRSIGMERWKVMLSSGDKARDAVLLLEHGAGDAVAGSQKIQDGLEKAGTAVGTLAENQVKLAEGLKGIDTTRLVSTGKELHSNTAALASGLARHKLLGSIEGLPPARDLNKLAAGAETYQGAIVRLADGLERAKTGAGTLAEKDRELAGGIDRLKKGSEALQHGLKALHKGLLEFAAAMPATTKSPENLATPVTVRKVAYAPVSSNGPAFAPYFMALSLWLGVLMSSFLFRLVVFPKSMAGKMNVAKVMGKGLIPISISCSGALMLGVTVQYAMKITPVCPFGFYAVLIIAVVTYASIIFSLVRLIGDAGKLLAIIFLVVQISSAGGAYPIELSPHFYRAVSPSLPLTHVVHGLRAAMFGSYGGDWLRAMLTLLPWMAVTLCLSICSARRFRYVEDAIHGPALELSFKR